MKTTPKTLLLICALFIALPFFGQEPGESLKMVKTSNPKKEVEIAANSLFKAKTNVGEKIKGRITGVGHDFIICNQNDTLFYNNLNWLKLKRKLTKETGLVILGTTIYGGFFTTAMIPGSLMMFAMGSSAAVFLIPVAIFIPTHIGFKTLAGRKYKPEKWQLSLE